MVLNLGLVLEKFSGSSTVPEYSRFELNLASTDGNVLRYLVPVLPHVSPTTVYLGYRTAVLLAFCR